MRPAVTGREATARPSTPVTKVPALNMMERIGRSSSWVCSFTVWASRSASIWTAMASRARKRSDRRSLTLLAITETVENCCSPSRRCISPCSRRLAKNVVAQMLSTKIASVNSVTLVLSERLNEKREFTSAASLVGHLTESPSSRTGTSALHRRLRSIAGSGLP